MPESGDDGWALRYARVDADFFVGARSRTVRPALARTTKGLAMSLESLPVLDSDRLTELVGWTTAVDALEHALVQHHAPGNTPLRSTVTTRHGQLLLMPAEVTRYAGVKIASVNADNPSRGLPKIQGTYLLLDSLTLSPLALVDGVALTSMRTAAVSALAVRSLSLPEARTLLVFGTGPQAWSHVQALRAVRSIEEVEVVGRDRDRVESFVERCRTAGINAAAATTGSVPKADVIACCSSAREPLFESRSLGPAATVVAVGSHEPDARELDSEVIRNAMVVVESRASAQKEAGDVLLAVADGVPAEETIDGELGDLLRGDLLVPAERIRCFKSVGEAWEDLIIAAAAYENSTEC